MKMNAKPCPQAFNVSISIGNDEPEELRSEVHSLTNFGYKVTESKTGRRYTATVPLSVKNKLKALVDRAKKAAKKDGKR